MKMKSIEDFVVFALLRMRCTTDTGRRIPLKQSHLLIDVNEYRSWEGYKLDEISMEQLARVLSKMKSEGKINRINWATPSSKNIWELVKT